MSFSVSRNPDGGEGELMDESSEYSDGSTRKSRESSDNYTLTDAVYCCFASPEVKVNFCVFLNVRGIRVTVDKAEEMAILTAQFIDNEVVAQYPSNLDGLVLIDVMGSSEEGADPRSVLHKVVSDESVESLKAILTAKGFKIDEVTTNALVIDFGTFLRKCWKEQEELKERQAAEEKLRPEVMKVEASKGEEPETEEEVLDGHSWARKYLPKGGFWGC